MSIQSRGERVCLLLLLLLLTQSHVPSFRGERLGESSAVRAIGLLDLDASQDLGNRGAGNHVNHGSG